MAKKCYRPKESIAKLREADNLILQEAAKPKTCWGADKYWQR